MNFEHINQSLDFWEDAARAVCPSNAERLFAPWPIPLMTELLNDRCDECTSSHHPLSLPCGIGMEPAEPEPRSAARSASQWASTQARNVTRRVLFRKQHQDHRHTSSCRCPAGPRTHSLLFPAAALYRRSLKIHSTVNAHYLFQMRCHCFRHRINFLFSIAPTKIQINFFSRNPSSITDFFLTLSLLLQMFKYT